MYELHTKTSPRHKEGWPAKWPTRLRLRYGGQYDREKIARCCRKSLSYFTYESLPSIEIYRAIRFACNLSMRQWVTHERTDIKCGSGHSTTFGSSCLARKHKSSDSLPQQHHIIYCLFGAYNCNIETNKRHKEYVMHFFKKNVLQVTLLHQTSNYTSSIPPLTYIYNFNKLCL